MCGILSHATPADTLYRITTVRDTVQIFFPQGKTSFDPVFEDNALRIKEGDNRMRSKRLDPDTYISHLLVRSSSSPEGAFALNTRLARSRADNTASWLRANYKFDRSVLDVNSEALDWGAFRRLVVADPSVPDKNHVLDIIRMHDYDALAALKGTESEKYMLEALYPKLRTTYIIFEYTTELQEIIPDPEPVLIPEPDPVIISVPEPVPEPEPDPVPEPEPEVVQEPLPAYNLDSFLKTNLLSLPLLVASFGAEVQVDPHLSISGIAYYSAINWFSETTKFRVLGIQPEVRYWLRGDMTGFFIDAHATFGWYNIATNGEYRYQDYKHRTPTLGGGIGGGYKVPLSKKPDCRWGLEFTVGAGVLPLHYDIFYNVHNGRHTGVDRKTYFGVDNASVTLTWRMDRKTKTGRKR